MSVRWQWILMGIPAGHVLNLSQAAAPGWGPWAFMAVWLAVYFMDPETL